MSCYTLFKGWLPLSQPPICLWTMTTFNTERGFGDLRWWSGLFPSRPRSLAPAVWLPFIHRGIRSLIGLSSFRPLQLIQCSTPACYIYGASPKTISERTSYYQIRLAFHSLPQVIRRCWTTHRFGPPSRFLETSPCSRQAHLASGLYCAVTLRPIKTRFRYASTLARLDKQHKISRWLILQ